MPNTREKLIELLRTIPQINHAQAAVDGLDYVFGCAADYFIANGVTLIPTEGIGEMSDGYHTFNELYHHRAVLFSVICNALPSKAWKSKQHDTGDMYDGMFIVGIETKLGQATYHYDIDPYWDMFNVPELEYAPKWDGHTPQEAIERIAHGVTVQEWISVKDRLPEVGRSVIAYNAPAKCAAEAVYKGEGKFLQFRWAARLQEQEVTHWMLLPQPPKGE